MATPTVQGRKLRLRDVNYVLKDTQQVTTDTTLPLHVLCKVLQFGSAGIKAAIEYKRLTPHRKPCRSGSALTSCRLQSDTQRG